MSRSCVNRLTLERQRRVETGMSRRRGLHALVLAASAASSISLMPEDLEKSMSKRDLANVIAYLRGGL